MADRVILGFGIIFEIIIDVGIGETGADHGQKSETAKEEQDGIINR